MATLPIPVSLHVYCPLRLTLFPFKHYNNNIFIHMRDQWNIHVRWNEKENKSAILKMHKFCSKLTPIMSNIWPMVVLLSPQYRLPILHKLTITIRIGIEEIGKTSTQNKKKLCLLAKVLVVSGLFTFLIIEWYFDR